MKLQEKTLEILHKRLAVTPPEIASLIKNGEVDLVVKKVQDELSFTEVQAARLSDEVVMTLLFLYPISNLLERITTALNIPLELAETTYQSVYQSIFASKKYLYNTPENSPVKEVTEVNRLDTSQPNTAVDQNNSNTQQTPPTIRTMANDMAKMETSNEPTFTSTQEALLKESVPKDPSHTPRWGSEGN